MPDEVIVVEGLTELVNGFLRADRGLGQEVRSAIKDVGEVVRVDSEGRARREIRNITEPWARMRLGIDRGNVVYVAPKSRRAPGHGPKRGGRWNRPNFGVLLITRAMEPALHAKRNQVEAELVDALENLNQNAGLIKGLRAIR